MSKEKILERIRKLLALSESPNEHEAALAAEKANAMLAEHNLSIDEVVGEDSSIVDDDAFGTKNAPWYRLTCHWVSQLYFCGYFSMRKPRSKYVTQHFVGEPHNVEVARLMAEYLTSTVYRLSLEAARSHPLERGRFRRSFRNAAASRLSKRISGMIEERKRMGVTTPEGRKLPALLGLYDKAQKDFEEWLNKSGIRTRTASRSMRSSHAEGYEAGRRAGDSISLNAQVGSSSLRRIGHSR